MAAELPALRLLARESWPETGEPASRDLDYVEVFAGDAAISRGLALLGYRGWSLDVRAHSSHDLLTPAGFKLLLEGVMRLRPGGLLWAAPPCSTWVYVSLHSTGRDIKVQGKLDSKYVQSQNALVSRLLLLSLLARSRGACFIWEQPHASRMFRYPPVAAFAATAGDLQEVSLDMGAYGLKAPKATKLWGSAPYMAKLSLQLSPEDKHGLRLRPDRLRPTTRYTDRTGAKRCQGGQDLKETQAYPLCFGANHALHFDAWRASGGEGVSPVPARALEIRNAWFLRDLHDPAFAWHRNTDRENKKRPRGA